MARSRELRVTISGDPRSLNRAFAKAGASAQAFEGRIGKASSSVGRNLATAAKVGTAALGVGLVGALKGSIDAFAEAERIGAQTNAVLKSTGGAANLTAKQVADLATAISKKSGMDDEAIQSGENLLLTFTKIRDEQGKGNDIFTQATNIMADMSTALGQDTKSSAIQLGKALNDPIKGVTALQRVGVSFTKGQRDQIKALVDSGKTMDAQKLILKELRTEFGGSAAAAGDTFAGKMNKAKVAVGNLGEAIGGPLADAIGTGADKLAGFVDKFSTSDRPARFFAGIKGHVDDAKNLFSNLFDDISKRRDQGASLGASIGASLADAVARINWRAIGDKISAGLSGAIKVSGTTSKQVEDGLNAAFSNVDGRKVLGGLVDVIGEALDALFSPSFWIEHFRAIFSIVTFVIPVGKILKIPGFATLSKFISEPIFRAVRAMGSGLLGLLGRAGSRAFTAFLVEVERAFPRVANAMLRVATGGANALRSFPGRVATWATRTVGSLADKLGDAVGRVTGIMGRVVGRGVSKLGDGAAEFARAAGRIVAGILRRFDDLAGNVPSKIAKALAAGTAKIGAWVGNFASAAVKLGRGLVDGIVRGVKSTIGKVAGAITGGIGGLVGKITGKGEGLGKKIGSQQTGGIGAGAIPGGTGALMGANPAMGGIAAIGARFGLRTSSGLRPGSITSSGNVSYHSSGEALDIAGSPGNMLRAFRYLKSHFGRRLAELIHTPGGVGIKNGQPHRYTGQVAADHYDHVHVALDLGRPGVGIGDGRGRRARTGDGPGGNVRAVWQFLLGRGFTPAQAAGIIGVMQGESGQGLSTTAINPRSGAYGIAQWTEGRKAALMRRRNPTGLSTQLQHLWSELQGPESAAFKRIKGAHSVEEAVNAWLFGFERPGAGEANLPGRTANARRVFNALRSVTGRGGAGPVTARGGGGGGGGSTRTPDTTSPYDLAIAESDVEIAEAQETHRIGARRVSPAFVETLAQKRRMGIVNARIRKVRKALAKKGLRPATKLRLRQELAQLLGERQTIRGRITELAQPAEGAAGTTPAVDAGGDTGAGASEETEADRALREAIEAQTRAAEELAQSQREHVQKLDEVRAEMKRQTDFATNVQSTSNFQLTKSLADILSGQIVGYGVAGRAFTPGRGVEYAF